MAIDDVKLEPNCPALGACSFETDMCGWTQSALVQNAQAAYVRATPSSQIFSGGNPHPTADHTIGATGMEDYILFQVKVKAAIPALVA
jgi:hypothetical protein